MQRPRASLGTADALAVADARRLQHLDAVRPEALPALEEGRGAGQRLRHLEPAKRVLPAEARRRGRGGEGASARNGSKPGVVLGARHADHRQRRPQDGRTGGGRRRRGVERRRVGAAPGLLALPVLGPGRVRTRGGRRPGSRSGRRGGHGGGCRGGSGGAGLGEQLASGGLRLAEETRDRGARLLGQARPVARSGRRRGDRRPRLGGRHRAKEGEQLASLLDALEEERDAVLAHGLVRGEQEGRHFDGIDDGRGRLVGPCRGPAEEQRHPDAEDHTSPEHGLILRAASPRPPTCPS